MSRTTRILVPTDFSAASDIAIRYALDLAARDGASIHLLHAIQDASFATAYPDGLFVELPGLREQLIEEAGTRLAAIAAANPAANVTVTTQVLVGQPSTAITGEANARGSDLIVMGTHGRSGIAHFMLGSVAERVLRTAPCPVLTVRDTSRAGDIIAAETVRSQVALA